MNGFSQTAPVDVGPASSSPTSSSWPTADGTFIQSGLVAHWDDRQWQRELQALKGLGMHYIILAPVLNTGPGNVSTTLYPSGLPGVRQEYPSDLVDNCLRNAEKAGFKVFLGLNLNERWWAADFSADWLYGQMETGNKVADELVKKYKKRYRNAFYGWYWVWEVDNLHTKTENVQDALAKALNINLDHLHLLTPSMPFMLCPFMNFRVGTAREYQQMWTHVFARAHFKPGDIFAPQDGIGAGGLQLDKIQEWYTALKEAVCTKPGLLFWSDAETFDQRFWTIAPLDRFIQQMELVRPYVSNIISFAYSHYYSPFKVNRGYHEAYLKYVRTGALPVLPVPDPVDSLNIRSDDGRIPAVAWQAPLQTSGIAGFYIFRDGVLVGNNQYSKEGQCKTSYTEQRGLPPGIYRYAVCSYTFTGLVSERKERDWQLAPAGTAAGKDGFIHNGVIAHRGAWKNHGVSENSIGSLKNAIMLGCEGSEFDVWMSADSGVIISHDPVIGGKRIETTSSAELEKVALLNNDFVPTLQQYLNIIKTQHRTRLFLEIKSSLISQERSLALTDRVVRMVRESGARDWVDYISFNYGVLSRIKELDPEAGTAYLTGDKKVEELESGNGSNVDYPFYSFHADTALTRNAHHAGLSVNVWTVDSREEMQFLLKQGVDRITTNEPEMLLDMLHKSN
ncbi:MAG: DUF4434 domain-containing protein [Puia sp.]|nr:DUF4434 domain-containing protein [Puia sp.]